MKKPNPLFILKLVIGSVIMTSFFMMLFFSYQHWQIEKLAIKQTKADVEMQVDNALMEISLQLGYLMGTGQLLADRLSNGEINYTNVPQEAVNLLKQRKKQKINFFSIEVAFNKGMYHKDKPNELANWYYYYDPITRDIKLKKTDTDYSQKKPDKSNEWFTKAIESKQAFWQEPHFGATTKQFVVGYSIPFFNNAHKDKAIGVVTINLSIDDIKDILYSKDYHKLGYAIILSKEDNIIYHPNRLTILKDINQKIICKTP